MPPLPAILHYESPASTIAVVVSCAACSFYSESTAVFEPTHLKCGCCDDDQLLCAHTTVVLAPIIDVLVMVAVLINGATLV